MELIPSYTLPVFCLFEVAHEAFHFPDQLLLEGEGRTPQVEDNEDAQLCDGMLTYYCWRSHSSFQMTRSDSLTLMSDLDGTHAAQTLILSMTCALKHWYARRTEAPEVRQIFTGNIFTVWTPNEKENKNKSMLASVSSGEVHFSIIRPSDGNGTTIINPPNPDVEIDGDAKTERRVPTKAKVTKTNKTEKAVFQDPSMIDPMSMDTWHPALPDRAVDNDSTDDEVDLNSTRDDNDDDVDDGTAQSEFYPITITNYAGPLQDPAEKIIVHEKTNVTFGPLCCSRDGSTIIVADDINQLSFLDAASGTLKPPPAPTDGSVASVTAMKPVTQIRASADSNSFIIGDEKNVYTLDATTGRVLHHLVNSKTPELWHAVAASPCGSFVASGGGLKHETTVWSAVTGEPVAKLGVPGQPVKAIAFSPCGRFLARCFRSTVQVLQISLNPTEAVVHELKLTNSTKQNTTSTNCIAYSPDGRYILVGFECGHVHIFESETGSHISGWYAGHNMCFFPGKPSICALRSVKVLPDWRVLTSGFDGRICLWDAFERV